ncbi:patatin-like phospholipase family protein [Desulfurivibrio sp. D14AmB]|uniref:patatin-like phospholipase family protein n=1 Tax=Desulfurivibrio sp. D14AmB TaxID=3374370 RepID=UPI00376EDA68
MKFFLPLLVLAALLVGFTKGAVAMNDSRPFPMPTVGLALGSGGAGGLAHIAMLRVFDDLGIKPARITGTSIGAVIGALYAAGLSAAEIEEIFAEFGGSSLDVLSRLIMPGSELTLAALLKIDSNGGIFDSGGFLKFLAGKVEARSFEDLAIPLAVVATDYWTGETVVLDQGDLFTAVQASMAVPGLFPPVQRGQQLLIDGGTSNPLPFDLLLKRHDLVVAIDVSRSRTRSEEQQVDSLDLLLGSFTIMQQSIIAARMEAAQPDIYIKPELHDIRMLHFNRIEAVLEQAKPAAAELQRRLGQYHKNED